VLTKRKRTIVLFVVSVTMNLAFFLLSHYLKLPFWLDTSGTIYITFLLDFPAGFLVGLINNVILSLFFYGFNSISYYIISAAVALVTGVCVRIRKRRHKELNLFLLFTLF
jgi:energy-coupling factor transport system substrate-specific component